MKALRDASRTVIAQQDCGLLFSRTERLLGVNVWPETSLVCVLLVDLNFNCYFDC